jgi:serine/threonine protein kinase
MGIDAGASEQRSPEELLGSVLGTCTLEKILGRGGMGVVYLAQQSRPHRQVAVKVLLLSLMPDPERRARFLDRFRREADAVAALEHPNILPIHEYGEQTDLAYLVMPYVAGGTLRDRVERKGPLPFAEVAGFLAQVAAALDYAHAHGVIHRDVKPQNMLLYPDKRLVLSDFGIAKVAEQAAADPDAPTAPQLTTMGHVVGTPDYIAPEQAMGHPVDARADIYSLGVVLFYLVTGRVPFVAVQPMTVAAKHVSEPPPPPHQFRPDLPPAAERVILKALAKDPTERYRSAGELSRTFRAALPTLPAPGEAPRVAAPMAGPQPVLPAPPPPKGVNPRRTARPPEPPPVRPAAAAGHRSAGKRWLIIGAALLLIIVAAGGVFAAIRGGKSQGTGSPTITTSPTRTPTPTLTPTKTPTPTATTPPPLLYQAEQFLPQQSDLPTGATLLSSQTATTPDQLQQLGLILVVDPTQGKYHWQKEVYVEVDQSGSAYFKIAIGQFTQAADAQTYYADVAKHIQPSQQQHQIGQQEIDGLCCDNNAASYNVIFQDQNVVVIILVEMSSSQAINDGLNLAANMDQRARQATQGSLTDLRLADLRQRQMPAAA